MKNSFWEKRFGLRKGQEKRGFSCLYFARTKLGEDKVRGMFVRGMKKCLSDYPWTNIPLTEFRAFPAELWVRLASCDNWDCWFSGVRRAK
jgi:hypothetical protein